MRILGCMVMAFAFALPAWVSSEITQKVVETEMFSIPLTPNMFNWTYQEFDKQYRFRASLLNKPELPSWLRYVYSERHHSGFIFGTAPRGIKSPITLEVIGLNRQDFETRRLLIELKVAHRSVPANHEVQLKIDNLNVEDLLDEHRMVRLREIFTMYLWPESAGDLHTTFLASALEFGARLPLIPTQGEGLVVRLGSTKPFSTELRRLRDEVRPLAKLSSCPRDYKRTTVERLFREHFTTDWCTFKLYTSKYTSKGVILKEITEDQPSSTTKTSQNHHTEDGAKNDPWNAPSIHDLPVRSYAGEAFLALTVPLLLMLLSVTALTAVLCCHFVDGKETVEICRYSNENDTSRNGGRRTSPSLGVARPYSPKSLTNLASTYNRPQPPPYGSKRVGGKSPSECSKTPDPAPTTLEESLRLIEEANIVPAEPTKTWFC